MVKLLIIWDWHVPVEEAITDRQAKLQAWRALGDEHDVHLFHMVEDYSYDLSNVDGMSYRGFFHYEKMLSEIRRGDFDCILSWGSIDRPIHRMLLPHKNDLPPVIFQFAGGMHDGDELELFEWVITQNECDQIEFEKRGKKATAIFGVDRTFWTPDPIQRKSIEVIYPASFCPHKCNEVVADKYGPKAVLVGKWDDMSLVDYCKAQGSLVLPHVPHNILRELYRASKKCVIPALAGSQRTIAEALSCGVEVELINPNNHKCREVLDKKESVFDIKQMRDKYNDILKEVCFARA